MDVALDKKIYAGGVALNLHSARRLVSLGLVLVSCLGLFGCGFIPFFSGGLNGLPVSITIPASVILSISRGNSQRC
jgi:hypothetical protein